MQIFTSKLAKTETATVQLNADEIIKLKKSVGAPEGANAIMLINGVSMHQLPNRWYTVVADDAPISKVQRIEAALQLIEKIVKHDYVLSETVTIAAQAEVAQSTEPVIHGGGHAHSKVPPSQLLMSLFSRI
jgi:hypothetical protein